MDALTDTTALITGGAGFIGSHLAAKLAPDNEVHVLDSLRNADPPEIPGVTFHEGDVRDTESIEALVAASDVVFHQAAIVSVEQSVADPRESHAVNVAGTLAVLEVARRTDTRVVLASSAAIYGQPNTTPIAESHPTRPTTPYGLEKLTCDHYARLYADLYGLETVALRYFNVYGPGQTGDYAGVISVFLRQALDGDPITVHGDGSQTRDFVYVDDVARANVAAARTDHTGTAYNVGTGESVQIRELAELVRDLVGADVDIVSTEPREGDIDRSEADIMRANARLGYTPTVELRDGLARTLEWFRRARDRTSDP